MRPTWDLKRTSQCAKCPWRKDTDPHSIPDGYCEGKHAALKSTIAEPGDLRGIGRALRVMACHETADAHCVGWLVNQLEDGNNIPLRLSMVTCSNGHRIKLVGEQHKSFKETLPVD